MAKDMMNSAPNSMPQMPGGGSGSPQADIALSQPRSDGGGGFLINHNAFSDSHAISPPRMRGESKSAGYPSFKAKR